MSFGSTYFLLFTIIPLTHGLFKHVLQFSLCLFFLPNFYLLMSNFISFCLHHVACTQRFCVRCLRVSSYPRMWSYILIVSDLPGESMQFLNLGNRILYVYLVKCGYILYACFNGFWEKCIENLHCNLELSQFHPTICYDVPHKVVLS